MRSRAMSERVIHVRRRMYSVLLILGVAGLIHLLLLDLQRTLFAGTVPAAGDLRVAMAPLTTGPSMDGFGAWAPDGKEIAFMRDGQILLTDPSGKRVQVLTSEPEQWDAAPAWRPDGKAIAFVRLSMDGDQARVMVMEPAGKGPAREVARERGPIGYLAWSPDGRTLYYSTKDRLVQAAVPGAGKGRTIFEAPMGWEMLSGGLAVEKAGRALIFGAGPRTEAGIQYDLWRLPLDGAQPTRLTSQGGIMPALNPTGQVLAYRNPRQETGIYLMNLASQAQERVVPDEAKAMYFHPNFAPDGKRLVLSRLLLAPPPQRGRGGFTSNLYIHALKGSGGDR